MKKLIYLSTFLGLFAFSCSDDPKPIQACNVDNVLEMPWLEEEITELEDSEFGREYVVISMAMYNSQPVFIVANCCPTCNSVVTVRDCGGNYLGWIGQDGISADEIKDRKVIWRSSENACNV